MRNTNTSYIDLNTNEIIHQIIYLVKYKNNYNLAANILLTNHLSIDLLNQEIKKLSQIEITKLANLIVENKNIRK